MSFLSRIYLSNESWWAVFQQISSCLSLFSSLNVLSVSFNVLHLFFSCLSFVHVWNYGKCFWVIPLELSMSLSGVFNDVFLCFAKIKYLLCFVGIFHLFKITSLNAVQSTFKSVNISFTPGVLVLGLLHWFLIQRQWKSSETRQFLLWLT